MVCRQRSHCQFRRDQWGRVLFWRRSARYCWLSHCNDGVIEGTRWCKLCRLLRQLQCQKGNQFWNKRRRQSSHNHQQNTGCQGFLRRVWIRCKIGRSSVVYFCKLQYHCRCNWHYERQGPCNFVAHWSIRLYATISCSSQCTDYGFLIHVDYSATYEQADDRHAHQSSNNPFSDQHPYSISNRGKPQQLHPPWRAISNHITLGGSCKSECGGTCNWDKDACLFA